MQNVGHRDDGPEYAGLDMQWADTDELPVGAVESGKGERVDIPVQVRDTPSSGGTDFVKLFATMPVGALAPVKSALQRQLLQT